MFIRKDFVSHSGLNLYFKIECDSLIDEDTQTIAYIIAQKYNFKYIYIYGIPTGGIKLANELKQYCNDQYETILIVDDVLTTGKSMEQAKKEHVLSSKMNIQGVVIFARSKCPEWIDPIFQLWKE